MKIQLMSSIILLAVFFMLLSCDSEDNPTTAEQSIYTSWVRDIVDSEGQEFTAELKINQNNSYEFILLTSAPNHTNSSANFTISETQITIIDDGDCGVVGVYNYVVNSSSLALVASDDKCEPRKAAIQGVWRKK